MTFDPVRFGRGEAQLEGIDLRLKNLEGTVTGIDHKLETVLIALAERRGERKGAKFVAGVVASAVSIIMGLVFKMLDSK